jgi:hypothetical protein
MGVDLPGAPARVQAMANEEWAAERAWICELMRAGKVARDIDELGRVSAATNRFVEEIGDSPERFVIHEAGHAVVAHALGWFAEFVEPEMPDGDAGARTWQLPLHHPTPERVWSHFVEQVVVGVAGTVAEEVEFGLAVPFEAMEMADRAREEYGVSEHQLGRLISHCEDRARTILTVNWPVVRQLADAQAAQDRIEGDELAAILDEVGRGG